MHPIWKIVGIIATIGGCIGFVDLIIPKKNWDKINNSYITKFESYNVPDTVLFDMFYEVSLDNKERINSKIWNQYASTILSIYENTSPKSSIRINDTIEGRITGHKRRIDLTLRQEVAGQDIFIAFKLYPWKSKITKSELHSFKYLIKDIQAAKGIIIINQDLDSTLIDFAQRNLISLCSLKDSDTKRWNEEIKIPVYWIQIIPKFHLKSMTNFEAKDKIHQDINRWQFSYNYGKETFTLLDYLDYKWKNNEIPHTTDSLHILYLDTNDLKVRVNKDDWREVSKFDVYYTTDENYWLRYFEPEKFKIIEDYITHDVVFSEIDITIKRFSFEDSRDWLKLNESDFEINRPKGLFLVVTANTRQLNIEDLTIESMGIIKDTPVRGGPGHRQEDGGEAQ